MNSAAGKFALLLVALCAPMHVAHAQMVLYSGSNQAGLVSTTLANPLTVRFSANSYVTLDWTVTSGSATIQESGGSTYSTFATNTNVARGDTYSIHLVLGNTPGPVTVNAHCGGCDTGIDIAFTETVNGHNSISSSGGSGQTGQTGTTLATPLTVQFAGVSNATLQWRVTAGTATFEESGSTSYTPLNGTTQTSGGQSSSVHLMLGSTPGPVTVTATCTAGCDTSTTQTFNATITAPPTNTMSLVSGGGQSGTAGTTLANPLTVGFSGAPVGAGGQVQLSWQVTSGNATIQESGSGSYTQMLTTSAGSTASVHLVLGNVAGPATVVASCVAGCTSTSPATFNETITAAGAYLSLSTFSGDGQTGAPGTTLPTKLAVLLTPTPTGFDGGTFPVNWKVVSGGATFAESGGSTFTDQVTMQSGQTTPGNSKVSLVLGSTPGAVFITVNCAACTPRTRQFNVTSATSAGAALSILSGDNQTGVAGSAADAPLVVQFGAPGSGTLSGQPINWTVISGDATLSASGSQTDTNGLSQINFNFGNTPGPVVIEASSTGGKVDFHSTSYLATATVSSGNNQTAAIGTTLAPFVVQIGSTQSSAKGLSGVPVQWKITSGQGVLAAATTTSDGNGQATNTLTLGSNPGTVTVTATLPGSTGITNTFTAHSVGSASIASFSGDLQTAPGGTTLQPFVVQVAVNGQAQPGITVDWSISKGSGTLAAAATISDASGRASNTLTLGQSTGSTVVRASIGGLGELSFTAYTSTVAGNNSQFTIVSGNNQALTPGQASSPLIVKLVDTQGHPVTGAVVAWSVNGQTGTLGSSNTPTDASGQAQNTLTVILPGSYTVTAQLPGNSSIPALTFNFGNGVSNLPSLSPTQQGVAGVIDKACPALAALPPSQLTPAQQDLLKRCTEIVLASGNNPGQVPGALGQLTNNKSLPQRQLANNVQLSQNNNLNVRLAELRQGGGGGVNLGGLAFANDGQSLPLAALGSLFRKDPKQGDDEVGKDFERWGFFATGMIERGGYSASNNRPGFDFHNTSLTAGVDYRFNDKFVGGIAAGYNQNDSNLDADLGKLNADSFSLNGYFTWYHNNDFYVEGSLVLDWLSYDLSRNIAYQIAGSTSGGPATTVNQKATASPDGRSESLSLSIGKDFNRGAWNFSPYLRGVYSHVSFDAFSESVADPNAPGAGLATSVDARAVNSLLAVGGLRASYTTSFDWGVLVPNALVEWNHDLRNDPQTVITRFIADPTQTPMAITDQPADQNYFNVGFGLNAVLPKGRSGFFLWEHLVGYAGAHENRFSLGIRIEF